MAYTGVSAVLGVRRFVASYGLAVFGGMVGRGGGKEECEEIVRELGLGTAVVARTRVFLKEEDQRKLEIKIMEIKK